MIELTAAGLPKLTDAYWAIIELMGHETLAGAVHNYGPHGLVAISQLYCGRLLPATLHGPGAIFRITPCSEGDAAARGQFGAAIPNFLANSVVRDEAANVEWTLAMVKSGALQRESDTAFAERRAKRTGLDIIQTMHVGAGGERDRFAHLYAEHAGKPYYGDLMASVSGDTAILLLAGPYAVSTWRFVMGPTDPAKARLLRPDSLRAHHSAKEGPMADNAVHGSASIKDALREIRLFFPEEMANLPPKMRAALDEQQAAELASAGHAAP